MFSKLDKAVKDVFDEKKVHEIEIDKIVVRKQVRTEFENAEQTIESLAKDIADVGLQSPITLRHDGQDLVLVMGERRLRACKFLGWTKIDAFVKKMDERTAKRAQYSENIHRKDLNLLEEASYLQDMLDEFGNADAVLDFLNDPEFMKKMEEDTKKTRQWLSKRLALLKLPTNAKRMISEKISTDVEAINAVAQVEKISPEKAALVVDALKSDKTLNVRKTVQAVKEEVKPKKSKDDTSSVETATTMDGSHEEPTEQVVISSVVAVEETEAEKEQRIIKNTLSKFYFDIYDRGHTPVDLFNELDKDTKSLVSDHLRICFDSGVKSKDAAKDALRAFRNGGFGEDGHLAFAWVSFMHGACGQKFSVVNILGCVKP